MVYMDEQHITEAKPEGLCSLLGCVALAPDTINLYMAEETINRQGVQTALCPQSEKGEILAWAQRRILFFRAK